MHQRKAALVVMGVRERKRRAESGVDVEDFLLAGPYRRAGLIDKSRGEPPPPSCAAHSPDD
jgi:hypothetical protein